MKRSLQTLILCCLAVAIGACVYGPTTYEPAGGPMPPPTRGDYGTDHYQRPIVHIADLEAMPKRFVPGRPIDFIVKLENGGGYGDGFDIGVFHESRLVGWIKGAALKHGDNVFKLNDMGFTGDPGAYIVRVKQGERTIEERRFSAMPVGDGRFTIDPGFRPEPTPGRQGAGPAWDAHRIDADIVNLEAVPKWFLPGMPIDFVARVDNNGPPAAGFDVGIFHEGRLVGWQTNKALTTGANIFKVRDAGFTGDPGAYIVRLRRAGQIVAEKRFITERLPDGRFTIEPGKHRGSMPR